MKNQSLVSLILALVLALAAGMPAAAEDASVPDCLTWEGYAETAAQAELPANTATRAYPVSAKRAVYADNENVKTIIIRAGGGETPYICYAVPEETARLRFEIAAGDNPETMVYVDSFGHARTVSEMLDPESGAYVFEQPTEGLSGGVFDHCSAGMLADPGLGPEDPDRIRILLIRDEAYMDEVAGFLREAGCEGDIAWETADPAQAGAPAESPRAYTVYVVDQDHLPVPGVYVNFCTDTACTMSKADENGVIVFDGAPDVYHLKILKLPAGYSADAGFELYTGSDYGDWVLFVRKD